MMILVKYFVTICVVTSALRHIVASAADFSGTCSEVSAPVCSKAGSGLQRWRYNLTTFPTFADDRSSDDVLSALSKMHPLISTRCSKYLTLYLCAVHSPVCTRHGVVPPCRELCQQVRRDCREVSETFGIGWPTGLACDSLPSFMASGGLRGRKNGGFIGDNTDVYLVSRSASLIWGESLVDDGKVSWCWAFEFSHFAMFKVGNALAPNGPMA